MSSVKLYNYYKHTIYPKFKDKRGFTRILKVLRRIASRNLSKINESPTGVFQEDWDNLLILDACRYDTYQEVFGKTEYRISRGSATAEFIEKTFSDGDFSDVVYVTGNPHFYPDIFKDLTGRDIEEVFYEVYNTYETDWDEENGVVTPEPLVRDALNARKLFPEKKLIVHFMQPHVPFLTSELNQSPNNPQSEESSVNVDENPDSEVQLAEKGKVEKETLQKHYKENLEYIKPFIDEVTASLEGKTVITSDHGELLGEKGIYGHPRASKARKLRKVPWELNE